MFQTVPAKQFHPIDGLVAFFLNNFQLCNEIGAGLARQAARKLAPTDMPQSYWRLSIFAQDLDSAGFYKFDDLEGECLGSFFKFIWHPCHFKCQEPFLSQLFVIRNSSIRQCQ